MILETLRLFTDRLNDGTTGLNAKLLGVPRSGGDAAPTPLALIADETRNLHASFGRMPDQAASYPCLLVSQPEGGNSLDPHAMAGAQRDGTVHVLLRFGQLESDAIKGTRDLHYTLRAAQRVLEHWMQSAPEAQRTLSSVCVYWVEDLVVQSIWSPVGDKICTGGMLITFRVRDLAPVS